MYADLQKLLMASAVGGEIEMQALPLSSEMTNQFGLEEARAFALGGGDDYELCFTVSARNEGSLAELVLNDEVRITRIGSVVKNDGLACTENGTVVDYTDTGFLHFGGSLD
jgi:thiamine-monophosphate kinase